MDSVRCWLTNEKSSEYFRFLRGGMLVCGLNEGLSQSTEVDSDTQPSDGWTPYFSHCKNDDKFQAGHTEVVCFVGPHIKAFSADRTRSSYRTDEFISQCFSHLHISNGKSWHEHPRLKELIANHDVYLYSGIPEIKKYSLAWKSKGYIPKGVDYRSKADVLIDNNYDLHRRDVDVKRCLSSIDSFFKSMKK